MNPKNDTYYDTNEEYEGFEVVGCIANKTMDPATTFGIPKALAPLGYVSAHIGKWHMRSDPGAHGYAVHDGDTDNNPGNTIKVGLRKDEDTPKRLTEETMQDPKLMFSITDKAIGFMEEQVKADKPFYVQISHYAMHAGSECKIATREKYVNHPLVQAWYEQHDKTAETVNRKEDPAVWLGMADDMDGRIGAVLDKIDELGIADNTYVIMVADNGYRHEFLPGLTQPLHARKWWVWEGGIRVPMIVKGPRIAAGSRFTGNVVNYDLLATFVQWAGGNPKELENIDGVSLAPYLAGQEPDEEFLNRNLYFHYPHYRSGMPHTAMVSGSHKVLHFWGHPDIPMLFDLSRDIGEVSNIAQQQVGLHTKLYDQMMSYLQEIGGRIPKTNPDYDPAKYRADKDYGDRINWGPFKGKRALEDDERDPRSRLEGQTGVTAGRNDSSVASSKGEIHQVILNEGERLIADKVVKFPRLKCRLKFEQNGKLLLRDDNQGKLFQSNTEGPDGPHFVALENGQLKIYRGTPASPEKLLWESPKPKDAGPYQLGITASKRLAIFRVDGKTTKIVWMNPTQN